MNRDQTIRNAVSLLVLISLLVLATGTTDSSGGGKPSAQTVDLDASVRFTGTQFIVQNKNSFDWTNVKLELNSPTFSSGFILRVDRIAAGQTYTIGALQFAKSDGERFNPFTHKPTNFSIWCDTPKGNGFYYGSWK